MANIWDDPDIPGKFVYISWDKSPDPPENAAKTPDPETIDRRVSSTYITSLKCWGLLYVDNVNMPLKMGASKLYHYVMVILIAINFFRYFGVYSIGEAFGTLLLNKMICHILFFWALTSIITGQIISKMQPVISKIWYDYVRRYKVVYSENIIEKGRRRVIKASAICWTLTGISAATYFFCCFHKVMKESLKVFLYPVIGPCDEVNITASLVIAFLLTVITAITVFTLGYILLMTLALRDEFFRYNLELTRHMEFDQTDPLSFVANVEYWRHRHMGICRLVKNTDNSFGLYILFVFISNIPMSCFLIYNLLMTQIKSKMVTAIFWIYNIPMLSNSITILLVIAYCGTKLNSEVSIDVKRGRSVYCIYKTLKIPHLLVLIYHNVCCKWHIII